MTSFHQLLLGFISHHIPQNQQMNKSENPFYRVRDMWDRGTMVRGVFHTFTRPDAQIVRQNSVEVKPRSAAR